MTPSTDELSRVLRGAADDIVERAHLRGPDVPSLWGRGRRATWAARAAGVALVAVTVLLVTTMGLVLRPTPSMVPADGETSTYPGFVWDPLPGIFAAGPSPVFALVGTTSGTRSTYAVDRSGRLDRMPVGVPEVRDGALAPDGLRVLLGPRALEDDATMGILDLTDGVVTRPLHTDDVLTTRAGDFAAWSPDSQHVVVDTTRGPAVLDTFANLERRPTVDPPVAAAGDSCDRFTAQDPAVRAAGWRDIDTIVGVATPRPGCGDGLDLLERDLGSTQWTKVAEVDAGGNTDRAGLRRVNAAPDGSRLLLEFAGPVGPKGSTTILVDARTGERVRFTGSSALSPGPLSVGWDECAPVWRDGQPLTASGGLRRPADGTLVFELGRGADYGCVVIAGAELTGAPGSSGLARWTARAWGFALPAAGILVVLGSGWMVFALHRSRRHGERFLPMIWSTRF